MPRDVRLTVVVTSHGSRLRTRWLLDSLEQQTLPRDRWDVVVDGDRRSGSAPLVVLVDDTSRPDPRWLEALLAAAEGAPGHIVRGVTLPDPLDAHPGGPSSDSNVLRPADAPDGAPEVIAPEAIVYAARPPRRLPGLPAGRSPRPVPEHMRVALLSPWYWPEVRRGSERILHDLAVDLLALGHEPRMLTSHPARTTRTVEDGFAVVRSRRLPEGPLRRLGMQEWLTHVPLTLHELWRGDHDAAVAAYLTDAAAAVAWGRRTGRPAVFTYMGIPERDYLSSRRGRLRMLESVTTGADAVVALSAAARDAVWRWLGVEARVIHPGVDLGHFTPGGRRAPEPTIACAADPGDARKRVDALVEAFAGVRREHPTARLRLMEPRDPAVRRRLERPGVEFAPWGAVRELYRDAWVSGLASREEAFGLVLVESMACGTPVFGRREGGVVEIVDRPEVGRLFDDEADLTGVLLETLELARDPATAAACRARAQAFSTRAGAEAYVELLRTLKRT